MDNIIEGVNIFAGLALFGRGFIIIGPTLILAGMILNMFAKFDFDDQRED